MKQVVGMLSFMGKLPQVKMGVKMGEGLKHLRSSSCYEVLEAQQNCLVTRTGCRRAWL
jgi:hypothetical protein